MYTTKKLVQTLAPFNSIRPLVFMSLFKALFPFFDASNEVYLDSAATSQRVNASLLAMQEYYCQYNANVHRGGYVSARLASNKYEDARTVVAEFLGAADASQIIFTSGTTDAINLIANGLNIADLQGSEILLFESEHHANLLPWQHFAAKYSLSLTRIKLGDNGTFNQQERKAALASITRNVAIVAMAHVSNALGNIYPVTELCKRAAEVGALSVIDGTQAPAHITVDVSAIHCDFYAISGHKMYAGTGIGALYGKKHCLEKLTPSKLGGEMISHVTWDAYVLQPVPGRFEAGTPNIAGAIGLAAAAKFIQANLQRIQETELALALYLLDKINPLARSQKLVILGNIGTPEHFAKESSAIALLSFYIPKIHANDIAAHFASKGVAIRAGHHCAMPLMQSLSIEGCARISIACYTTYQDIDAFVVSLYQLFQESANDDQKAITKPQQFAKSLSALPTSIGDAVSQAPDWNAKHRLLLIHSKSLATLPTHQRTIATEITGCEARVWMSLIHSDEKQAINASKRKLYAYSESKVIRGILALIIEKVNQLPYEEVSRLDIHQYLNQVGLSHYFSQGRRDGISQVIQAICKKYTQAS